MLIHPLRFLSLKFHQATALGCSPVSRPLSKRASRGTPRFPYPQKAPRTAWPQTVLGGREYAKICRNLQSFSLGTRVCGSRCAGISSGTQRLSAAHAGIHTRYAKGYQEGNDFAVLRRIEADHLPQRPCRPFSMKISVKECRLKLLTQRKVSPILRRTWAHDDTGSCERSFFGDEHDMARGALLPSGDGCRILPHLHRRYCIRKGTAACRCL